MPAQRTPNLGREISGLHGPSSSFSIGAACEAPLSFARHRLDKGGSDSLVSLAIPNDVRAIPLFRKELSPGLPAFIELTIDGTRIRDVNSTREWMPPIGALGGPPAHEAYRDLVLHAGLRLYRGPEGEPWVTLQDGERRRSFRVPSHELLGAMDRFRMRRNLRPVPEPVIDEFVRIIQARVTDPDANIPAMADGDSELAQVYERSRAVRPLVEYKPAEPEPAEEMLDLGQRPPDANPTISGGVLTPTAAEEPVPHYYRVLKSLVRDGAWLGTLTTLSEHLGESPDTVFANLLEYRSALAATGIVIAPVEVAEGWRWLAVDRSRAETVAPAPPVHENTG